SRRRTGETAFTDLVRSRSVSGAPSDGVKISRSVAGKLAFTSDHFLTLPSDSMLDSLPISSVVRHWANLLMGLTTMTTPCAASWSRRVWTLFYWQVVASASVGRRVVPTISTVLAHRLR